MRSMSAPPMSPCCACRRDSASYTVWPWPRNLFCRAMRLRLMRERSSSAGLGSVRVREHVGVILARSWLQAGEILLDQNAQRLAVVECLLAFDGYLVAGRPALYDSRRQHDRDQVAGVARPWLAGRGIALERIAQADAAAEADGVAHVTALGDLAQFLLRHPYADRIAAYPELHSESSSFTARVRRPSRRCSDRRA